MDPRRGARGGSDPRRPVVAEEDPDASARRPESRARQRGKDIPHDDGIPDDAEGAGNRPPRAGGTAPSEPSGGSHEGD